MQNQFSFLVSSVLWSKGGTWTQTGEGKGSDTTREDTRLRGQQENPVQGRVRKHLGLAPVTAKTSRAKAITRCVGMVPWSYRKSRREVGCASPSSLPGGSGIPTLWAAPTEVWAREPCVGSQEMEGFPVWSLLVLTAVVLAACRCSQHNDSSWGRNRKWGGFLGVLPMLCCRP